jgi:hypothetical protein
MFPIFENSIRFFSAHVWLNSIAHSAGGFGIAVVLQNYLQGNVFVCPLVGWALIIFSTAIHIYSVISK